ncbi:MAG: sporulation integral membrane protein YtvI [Firmicutes bacterium]|nr:sporulation integral membrane protein YtvI [Bacillota bacterium]
MASQDNLNGKGTTRAWFVKTLQSIPKPIVYTVLLIIGGILLGRWIFPYTAPFVVAVVLAVVIMPVVDFLVLRLKLPRGLITLVVLLLLFALVLVIGASFLVRGFAELQDFVTSFQGSSFFNVNRFESWLQSYEALQEYIPANFAQIIREEVNEVSRAITDFARSLLGRVIDLAKNVPTILLYVAVTFLATFFFIRDRETISSALLQLLPQRYIGRTLEIWQGIVRGAMGYLRAQLTIVSINTLVSAVVFLILKASYFWFLVALMFIVDVIPLIGPGLIYYPWIAWSLLNRDFSTALILALGYGTALVIRQVLEPKLVGDRIGVHPLLTLFAMFVGARVLGVMGVVIGPFTVIVLKAVLTLPKRALE